MARDPHPATRSPHHAFIDLGTNTLILLIVEIRDDGSYRVLHDEARVVRLGEGIHQNAVFLDAAMDRAFEALAAFGKTIADFSCRDVTAVGTAGFRNARNADVFIRRVRDGLGIEIRVISGEREAELVHAAAKADFGALPRPLLVLDIGGGSTELIFEETDGRVHATSLPFGSVKLTENFIRSDPPAAGELSALDAYVAGEIGRFEPRRRPAALVATAGTATTLAALVQNLSAYDPEKVHASTIALVDLDAVTARLEAVSLRIRQTWPCLEPKRADVIVAGAHILRSVARYFDLTAIHISDRGLRYGLVCEKLAEKSPA